MVVTVILLLLSLSHTLMAASVSLGYLDCQPFKVERMAQCAARHQILDLISFSCYEPGKRGPCEEGKRLVLNKESSVRKLLFQFQDMDREPCQSISLFMPGHPTGSHTPKIIFLICSAPLPSVCPWKAAKKTSFTTRDLAGLGT